MPAATRVAVLLVATLLVAPFASAQGDSPSRVPPVPTGEVFPPASYGNLNQQAGGPASIDLAEKIGKKPVVLVYWIAGLDRADKVFQDVEKLYNELGSDKLALYGVAIQRPGREADEISKRLAELGIEVPVLDDASFVIGQQLRVQSAPNVSIIDSSGRLRLTNGASLAQVIGYQLDLEAAIRRVAEKGAVGNYGHLARYYPVKELVGKPCPDFKAPLLSNSVEQRWSSMLKGNQLNVLIFWSVDCPHCRKSLPEINSWLKSNSDGINVISAARIDDDVAKTKTKEFCDLNQFVFPTLMDKDQRISSLYQVTSTPTVLIIRPDGIVDSVVLSGTQDLARKLAEKKAELL